MISNCGKDENGKYIGGNVGDQTGKEWHVIPWYNRPWNCVLRHPKEEVRELIAKMARAAANNNNIGYDQGNRLSFWEQLKKASYKVNDIKTKCEADCSAGVCSIVKAVGYRKNIKKLKGIPITTTHYMKDIFKKAGFRVLTDKKYLESDAYLLPGDILLNEQHHTATNLDIGSKVKTTTKPTQKEPTKAVETKKYVKVKTNGRNLYCRKNAKITSVAVGAFKNGTKLTLLEKTNKNWYKVKGLSVSGKTTTGYCAAKWLKEV